MDPLYICFSTIHLRSHGKMLFVFARVAIFFKLVETGVQETCSNTLCGNTLLVAVQTLLG
ncbi:hypothetical protein RRF57_006234 [Xylaria bambusicola]|uniref:Uncharacterized protein n=1 Tax=Xylaria bambusicola TaxID=326684 RepID=A0AAN7UNF6_9PEZI